MSQQDVYNIITGNPGSGKTESILQRAVKDRLKTIIIVTTLHLAEQLKERLEIMGIDSTVWYGLTRVKKNKPELCDNYNTNNIVTLLINNGMFASFVCRFCDKKKGDSLCPYKQQFFTDDDVVITTPYFIRTNHIKNIKKGFPTQVLAFDDSIETMLKSPDWETMENWYNEWNKLSLFASAYLTRFNTFEEFIKEYSSDSYGDKQRMLIVNDIKKRLTEYLNEMDIGNSLDLVPIEILLDPDFLYETFSVYNKLGKQLIWMSKLIIDVVKVKSEMDKKIVEHNKDNPPKEFVEIDIISAYPSKNLESDILSLNNNAKFNYINVDSGEPVTKVIYKIDSASYGNISYAKFTINNMDWMDIKYNQIPAFIEHSKTVKPYTHLPYIGLSTHKDAGKPDGSVGLLAKRLVDDGITRKVTINTFGSLDGTNDMYSETNDDDCVDLFIQFGTYKVNPSVLPKLYKYNTYNEPNNKDIVKDMVKGIGFKDVELNELNDEITDNMCAQAIHRSRILRRLVPVYVVGRIPEQIKNTFKIEHLVLRFIDNKWVLIPNVDKMSFIENFIKTSGGCAKNELVSALMDKYKVTQRWAYQYVNNFIELNKDKLSISQQLLDRGQPTTVYQYL